MLQDFWVGSSFICMSVSFQSSAAYVNGDSTSSGNERELEVRWKSDIKTKNMLKFETQFRQQKMPQIDFSFFFFFFR